MLDDKSIIQLFFRRSEEALEQLHRKYGSFLFKIAMNLLENREDSEECLNDSYLKTWNSIPPAQPECLRAYTGKITRNTALNRIKYNAREKRGKNLTRMLSELEECIPSQENLAEEYSAAELSALIGSFISAQSEVEQCIFIRRYWMGEPSASIAKLLEMPESTVNWKLYDLRKKLKTVLKNAGYNVPCKNQEKGEV